MTILNKLNVVSSTSVTQVSPLQQAQDVIEDLNRHPLADSGKNMPAAPQVAAVQTAQAESRRVASDSAQLLTADTISAVLVDGDEGSEAEEWDLLALDV